MNFFQKNHNFFKKTRIFFTKARDFQNHAISRITLFQNHAIFRITRFQKSHYFKITRFSESRDFKNHIISKSRDFKITLYKKSRYFQNHAIFYHSLLFLKLPCFKKKFPFKVHFGIPRLTICKKAVFSLQDLGFRLGNMIQTHN